MTDRDIADRVYIEPLTVKVLEQLIEKEKPDSLLPTLGGQAGLNLGMELDESGFLAAHNVKLLGTTSQTIRKLMEVADKREIYDNPLNPYTQALLSAIPSTDITKKKERIILAGDHMSVSIIL